MLEVVAVLGASQMGMSKVFGGMQHHRIAQVCVCKRCSSISEENYMNLSCRKTITLR